VLGRYFCRHESIIDILSIICQQKNTENKRLFQKKVNFMEGTGFDRAA